MFPLNTFENLCVFFPAADDLQRRRLGGRNVLLLRGQGPHLRKRGFLNGFICPIYGHGALLVLYVLHGGLKIPC